MKATIKPLEGKYYGTEIVLEYHHKSEPVVLSIWVATSPVNPSPRELERMGITQQQFSDVCSGKLDYDELVGIYDGHYESVESLEVAENIVKSINDIPSLPYAVSLAG